jgi:hypothetical protein
MAKTKMLCPFSNKICEECPFYRGRHYLLCYYEKYRGHLENSGKKRSPFDGGDAFPDFEILMKKIEPWKKLHESQNREFEMTLNLIDMEEGGNRDIDYREAKKWDWKNTQILRMIDGRHVTSWEQLLDILQFKSDRGDKKVDVYEGPRYMLLGGG